MKKLLALFLALLFVFSFAACGGAEKPDDASSDSTSSEELAEGYQVEYTSVAKGYIDHTSAWASTVVEFGGFECMDEEYLFLPVGTTIMSNEKFGIYCYERSGEYMVLSDTITTGLGQTISPTGEITLQKGSYTITEKTYIRIVVKGALSDVKIYVPLELENQVKIGKISDFANE